MPVVNRLAAGVLAVLLAAPAGASTLRSKRKELDRVNAELRKKREELERYRRRQAELKGSVSRLKKDEVRAKRKLDELDSRGQKARTKASRLGDRLDSLGRARDSELRLIAAEVEDYTGGLGGQSSFFGTGDLWENALRRSALDEKTRYLAQVRMLRGSTAVEHQEAARRGGELLRRAERERVSLKEKKSRLRRTQASYRTARTKAERARTRVRELQKSAKALGSLIQRLMRRKGGKVGKKPPIPERSLPWPVKGKVLSSFGKKRVAELDTWVIHNGIEIGAAEKTSVKAVAGGKVIFAGPFRSYGKMIIVDHGKGFYSIYGAMGAIRRANGEKIRAGSVVGTVGKAASGKSRLYLELRQGGAALDPVRWLKKR